MAIKWEKLPQILGGILFLLIAVYIFWNAFRSIKHSEYDKGEKELISLTAYLVRDPQYFREGKTNKSSGNFVLRIYLDGYAGLNLGNNGVYLAATDYNAVLSDIKYEDTVTIKVLKTDLEEYNVQRKSPSSFLQLVNGIKNVPFYSLNYKGKEYVTNLIKAAEEKQAGSFNSSLLIGVLFIGCGMICFFSKK